MITVIYKKIHGVDSIYIYIFKIYKTMLCIIYGHAFDSKCAKPSSWLVNINFRKVAYFGEG